MADGDASAASHQILEHPLVVPDAAAWVQEPQQLADIADQVRAAGAMAYDTEFIGESTYWPMLCLIQIATPDRLVVIDALAEMDLEPVWSLLADPGVVKVVHGGGQDLEPVVRHLDREAVNVFDTQVAAGFCGLPYPLSLARLVQDLLQVRLAKGLTFTSWDERPLSPAHLRYAADDVRYGLALREALEAVLTENGNLERAGAV
ncbi:MAG: ribonuclease D [Phycisphaerae bacterium]|nr:ribonuclease D [Phycisphaerae bacterium]